MNPPSNGKVLSSPPIRRAHDRRLQTGHPWGQGSELRLPQAGRVIVRPRGFTMGHGLTAFDHGKRMFLDCQDQSNRVWNGYGTVKIYQRLHFAEGINCGCTIVLVTPAHFGATKLHFGCFLHQLLHFGIRCLRLRPLVLHHLHLANGA